LKAFAQSSHTAETAASQFTTCPGEARRRPTKKPKIFAIVHDFNPKNNPELDRQIFFVTRHTSASAMMRAESVFKKAEKTGTGMCKHHYSDDIFSSGP